MKGQLKGKKSKQVAKPALSLPGPRQPSGYSSASFYDLSSLPSLTESTSDSDFKYSSPSKSTASPEDASPARSEQSHSSLSLVSVHSKSSAESRSHSERQSSAESGPSLQKPSRAASENDMPLRSNSFGLEGWTVDSDSPDLSWDRENAVAWPPGLTPSGTASPSNVHSPIMASPASSLASGPSEPPQSFGHPGHPSHLSSGDDSDSEGPVRFVIYSPHKTPKDLRGDCSCWQGGEKKLR